MKFRKYYLAIDFGASNGRAIVGKFNGDTLSLEEAYRFENRPVYLSGTLYWDFLRLFSELKTGIVIALKMYNKIDSLGVDTWGIDFGLLDRNKNLLSNPVHYRDRRTVGVSEEVYKIIPEEEIYKRTQAQILEMNSLYQLYSLKLRNSAILENSKHFLLLGDLFNFFLTGEIICEYSNATITQLFDQKNKRWEKSIIRKLSLPENIFIEVTEPGKIIGELNREVCEELECRPVRVSLPGYDTTSEITAIPISMENKLKNWAYLNCGTWSMVGIMSSFPIVTKYGFKEGFGNEGGFEGRYHYIKNIIGLWIIQQCRKKWMKDKGEDITWNGIIRLAEKSEEKNIFIDVDYPSFEKEIFDMPACILNYCRKTNQETPENIGEISRVAYESLVMKYKLSLQKIERITDKKIELLHLVGGGSKNNTLCQWISDATGLPVIAGPPETTTYGNILSQLLSAGEISSIEEGREILVRSIKLDSFEPKNSGKWDYKFEKYKKIIINSI